jgi:hypothetical protein
MICDKPKDWVQWLPFAEYYYNTSFHHSTRMTPFEAMFGYSPPPPAAYLHARDNPISCCGRSVEIPRCYLEASARELAEKSKSNEKVY